MSCYLLLFIISSISKILSSFSNEYHVNAYLKKQINEELTKDLRWLANLLEDQNLKFSENKLDEVDSFKLALKLQEMKNSQEKRDTYDIENRIILQNIFIENTEIQNFQLFNYKIFTKHDNGLPMNLLCVYNTENTLKILDLFGNLIFQKSFDHDINDVFTYNNMEESSLFLLTNNRTVLRKFILNFMRNDILKVNHPGNEIINQNKSFENNFIRQSGESNKIKLNVHSTPSANYEISTSYYRNMKELKFELVQVNEYSRNSSKILNVKSIFNRGERYLAIEHENNFLQKLNDELYQIRNYSLFNLNTSSNYYIFLNLIAIIEESKNTSYLNVYSLIDNNIQLRSILSCKFDRKISAITVDTNNNHFYVLFKDNRLEVFMSKQPENSKNQINTCFGIFDVQLDGLGENIFGMEILKKDLVINTVDNLIYIDISNLDTKTSSKIRFINKDSKLVYNFNKYNQSDFSENTSKWSIQRNNYGNFILFQDSHSKNTIYLWNVLNLSLQPLNDGGFNFFKIPIIFISIIVIVFYQYFMKSNDSKSEMERKKQFREQILNKMEKPSKDKPKKDAKKNKLRELLEEEEEISDSEEYSIEEDDD